MPRPAYAVDLTVAPRFAPRVRARSLAALARRALAAGSVPPGAALSLVITDDRTVRRLNRRYLGIDSATDVLSFDLRARDRFVAPPAAKAHLGEVIISFPTAARQARRAGVPVDAELAHLLVHGVLHILGHHHDRPGSARQMRAHEEALLGSSLPHASG